ncbi:MAG: hypothetical protein RLN62_04960 [Rickettsiales bacterium]
MKRLILIFLSIFVLSAQAENELHKSVDFDYQHQVGKQTFHQSKDQNFKEIHRLKPLKEKEPLDIGTYFYDINGDGKDELFIFVNDHLFCGTRGCTTKIIDFSGPKPAEILNMHTYHKVHVLKDKTNGYNNLGVEGNEETHIKPGLTVLYWDGVQYRRLSNAQSQ